MGVFLEVIEWFDETGKTIVQRIPAEGSAEIKLGAQVIVRENQAAVFFRDGKAYDILGPGRHTVSTLNLPLIKRDNNKSRVSCRIWFFCINIFISLKIDSVTILNSFIMLSVGSINLMFSNFDLLRFAIVAPVAA